MMKTELFGGSEDGKQIEINGYMPSEIRIPAPIRLTAEVPEDYDPRQMLTMPTLYYKLDTDGKYKAEDMTK
jgi:hypothetical protein